MKLQTIMKNRVLPLDIDAEVYVRDLPTKQMQAVFGTLEEDMKEKPEETILKLFTDVICDKDGKKFEGFKTYEDLEEALSLRFLTDVISAIPVAIVPGAADAGK